MRIAEHEYRHIKHAIEDALQDLTIQQARQGHKMTTDRDNPVKDLEISFRWWLLYCARIDEYVHALHKSGVNDNHIDTALRRVVSELEARERSCQN